MYGFFSGYAVDWHSSPVTALSCNYLGDCHGSVISHVCHYRHAHNPCLSLWVEESGHEANLAHVGSCFFWTSCIPYPHFSHGSFCRTCVHLYLSAQRPKLSVLYPCFMQSACSTWHCCLLCWNDGLSNYQKGWTLCADQSPMNVLSPVYQDWEVVHPMQQKRLYPDWKTPVVGRVEGGQVHLEGLKPQAPSTWQPPLW